jgi:hypothetical protein
MAKRTTSASNRNATASTAVSASPVTIAGPASPTLGGGKPTREQIAARAQEIYSHRCRTHEPGNAVSDWLKAEVELAAAAGR